MGKSYLKWNFDEKNGVDVADPTGDLYIIGEEGEVVEKFTNLEVFFEVLVEGAQNIKIGKSVVIEPLTEPNEFHFDYQDRVLQITYGRQQTTILDRNKFIKDVYQSVSEILDVLDRQSEKEQIPKRSLVKLREYSI